MKIVVGGNRVGSGGKMKTDINDYNRSTHNLSEDWLSTMSSGVLYPCMCKLAMRGDTFEIDADGDIRTIPTNGPLFGSFKFQVDVYQCPARLYQALLHNNPQAIGLKMNQVKFPVIQLHQNSQLGDKDGAAFSKSCLIKYLGISGLGMPIAHTHTWRNVNAIPVLAYYDIFKNYYANKQEEKAYVIGVGEEEGKTVSISNIYFNGSYHSPNTEIDAENGIMGLVTSEPLTNEQILNGVQLMIYDENSEILDQKPLAKYNELLKEQGVQDGVCKIISHDDKVTYIMFYGENLKIYDNDTTVFALDIDIELDPTTKSLQIIPFDLSNIDDMRYDILTHHTLGVPFKICQEYGDQSAEHFYLPYSTVAGYETQENGFGRSYNNFAMNGLVLKTYQNDMFNNWLNTEWIEGENGINELTKVAVVDGKFSMDALNMAEKLYNMLNRVAMSDGSYEGWQDVVYEEVQRRQIESPIYCGGFSKEVIFDEIVQTTPAEGKALGTLGGRGRATQQKKGGKIHIKCTEACFIIAIASLTPRQVYTQSNEFYMTDVFSMDDLHKPGMDGIGYQDLLAERMAWFGTAISQHNVLFRPKVGKLPAWIEYMTSVDRAFGDFAEENGAGYMILNRNYEYESYDGTNTGIKDATTYIDPQKYNYVFAYDALDAQNFWCKIHFDIKARRLMSARIIPHV